MKSFMMLLGGLMLTLSAFAQEAVPFNGLLLDGKGKPIRRARVYVNEDRYTQSDKQGRFGLTNVNPDDTIRIRYNKHTYEVPVAGKTTLTVRVLPDLKFESEETPSLLDYGFSYVKQREYAGYDSRITGEELMRTGCTDILSALSGMIPGLNISYDDEKGTYVVDIRGSGQAADLTPLYVVDEIVVPSIDHIHLNQVAYVIVMKSGNMYGSRGGNGAIVVRTKSAETVGLKLKP
ncbi:MAG: hypothetical protein E7149_00725 [Rikenellaceae bacterium]|nr:hypothetical protein [Rikenellaceae bacterium]MBR7169762.1 TonB-dependent receptor plug domain-containing protein [Alistipes sp.]